MSRFGDSFTNTTAVALAMRVSFAFFAKICPSPPSLLEGFAFFGAVGLVRFWILRPDASTKAIGGPIRIGLRLSPESADLSAVSDRFFRPSPRAANPVSNSGSCRECLRTGELFRFATDLLLRMPAIPINLKHTVP
jgi:hypothetical protein